MTYDYDVIVLGGGSAGSAAAAMAHSQGARTAMINDGELGGLCILRGCMPTKALLSSTHALHEAQHTSALGVHLDRTSIGFDFPFMMRRKSALVERFKRAKVASIENGGYDVIDARGSFIDGHTIDLRDRRVTANRIVLATGSLPTGADIPGIKDIDVWTSDDVLEATAPPRSLIVHGAGPIGLEFSEFFSRLGTKVTLINRSMPCSRIDAELCGEVMRMLSAQENLDVLVPASITRVERGGEGVVATVECDGETRTIEAETYLCALGRRPAVDGLNLEAAGIGLRDGHVRHNAFMQTTAESVYVAGDATGGYQILHIGNQEGRVAGFNAAAGANVREMDYRLKMAVVFTDPPIALLGQSASEASAAGRDVFTATKYFSQQGRGICMGVEHGLLKLVVDRETSEILGCQILGPRADDLIHIPAAVMAHHGTVQDLYELPWYHPTLSEAFVEVARDGVHELMPLMPAMAEGE